MCGSGPGRARVFRSAEDDRDVRLCREPRQTVLEGQRLLPRDHPSDTVFIFMHPASTLQLLPMPTALAAAGYHVLCCGSRYAKNDSALIMEKVVYDLGRTSVTRVTS